MRTILKILAIVTAIGLVGTISGLQGIERCIRLIRACIMVGVRRGIAIRRSLTPRVTMALRTLTVPIVVSLRHITKLNSKGQNGKGKNSK